MFAVPGWSLGELKTQVDKPEPKKSKSASSKKRKRQHEEAATNANEDPSQPVKDDATLSSRERESLKRRKRDESQTKLHEEPKHERKPTRNEESQVEHGAIRQDNKLGKKATQQSEESQPKSGKLAESPGGVKPSKKTEKRRQQRETAEQRDTNAVVKTTSDETSETMSKTGPTSSSKLTPLQTAMRQKLAGARFRHLNETLYTSPSVKALALFESNPAFFDEYHSGFRQQVSSWPDNPVRSYVEDLKRRGKIRWADKNNTTNNGEQPLPRSDGKCTVADLGCGDAALGQQVSSEARKLAIKVLSYDLHSNSPHITKADIAHLPIQDGSVNIAIFCLALMGTNWIDFIEEVWRVLHWKGELWIAEIKSRFAPPKRRQVEHSVGKRRKKAAGTPSDTGNGDTTLGANAEGAENQENRTDVSAFVDVLIRRGFALQSEGGIDLRNKMFVKMRFVKSSTPTKGKHAGQGAAQRGPKGRCAHAPRSDDNEMDESSILKPCLYKIR